MKILIKLKRYRERIDGKEKTIQKKEASKKTQTPKVERTHETHNPVWFRHVSSFLPISKMSWMPKKTDISTLFYKIIGFVFYKEIFIINTNITFYGKYRVMLDLEINF